MDVLGRLVLALADHDSTGPEVASVCIQTVDRTPVQVENDGYAQSERSAIKCRQDVLKYAFSLTKAVGGLRLSPLDIIC
jgi:hypothetical protein